MTSSPPGTPEKLPVNLRHKRSDAHLHHWRPTKIKVDNVHDILSQYDTLLVDCDGVLWSKNQLSRLPKIKEALQKLRDANKRLIFVSNNSLYSRHDYKEKIAQKVGYDVKLSDMFAIDYAIAVYLTKIAEISGTVYVIGWPGLADELKLMGLDPIGIGSDPDPVPLKANDLLSFHLHQDVKAVVVGFDSYFCYNKLFKAACYLKNPECEFVASSVETSLAINKNLVAPLEGTFVAALTAATKRKPVVVGKPNKFLFDCVKSMNPTVTQGRTLMIGDTLETDVVFAKNTGIDSLLVLTGSCSGLDLERLVLKDDARLKASILPDYVMHSVAEFDAVL
ncbi:glycerol-3-phosphate phosphatase-like isoform X2 [Lineus longissimus]|uniref:glycerol-3-phosphate phosphatase-like isoform X2 n=1 Tax=Lineus longissimus TaxID=88925 RepID=UPI00315D6F5B